MPTYTRIKSLDNCCTRKALITAVENGKPVGFVVVVSTIPDDYRKMINTNPIYSIHEVRP